MPLRAMCLRKLAGASGLANFAALHVFNRSDELQVVWVDAVSDPAKVVSIKPGGR